MKDRVIIFDLKYTPYRLGANATMGAKRQHKLDRPYYDLTGKNNILDYMNTEEKRISKDEESTFIKYLQKNTGVFNQDGFIQKDELDEMKKRAKENKGNIWHGFISLDKEDSIKINSPDKCMRLVRNTFNTLFQEAHINSKNIDLICALHTDRPHHLHIHFSFWEKEPLCKTKSGEMKYRSKGKISEEAIANMFIRLGLFLDDEKDKVYEKRDKSILELRGLSAVKVAMHSSKEIREKILSLAKDLPLTGRLQYESEDMADYRGRVDEIVKLMLDYDKTARKANAKFYRALEEKRVKIKNICSNLNVSFTDNGDKESIIKFDEKSINIIDKIERDYKRRQGNIILKLCKFVKPEYYERNKDKKYKQNDKALKKRLIISHLNIDRHIKKMFKSFGPDCNLLERDFSHRLQDIEKEIEIERANQNKEKDKEENYKS